LKQFVLEEPLFI